MRQVKPDDKLKLIPVVVLTSMKDLISSYGLCVNSCEVQPVNFREIVNVIRELGMVCEVIHTGPPGGVRT